MRRNPPTWFILGQPLVQQIAEIAAPAIRARQFSTAHIAHIPIMALLHMDACLRASIGSNQEHAYSAAMAMLRHCVEAITLVDVGLQSPAFAEPVLQAWWSSKKSHGEIRAELERTIWPQYGVGLWDEPWCEFFGNLARSVQPYAHYTPDLMGWQYAVQQHDSSSRQFRAAIGPGAKDALKQTRVTFLHVLVAWTVARLLLASGWVGVGDFEPTIKRLGASLASSKLLFQDTKNWGDQLLPHVFFKAGHDWWDPR